MSLLQLYSTPAERARGASWADRFESAALVERNGGAVTGAPTFSPDGVVLDGVSDYLTYSLTGQEFDSAGVTIVIEFTPDFDTDNNNYFNIVDCEAANQYRVFKGNNAISNQLYVYLGDTLIAGIAEATYSPFWTVGEKHILVISGTTGDTSAWLNGSLILDADATAWTPKVAISLYMGANNAGTQKFDGTIHKVQVFTKQLDDAECIAISTNAVYNYIHIPIVNLPMGTSEHDAANVRSLDISENNHHAVFGDGSTPGTYPTKTTKNGYDFDGAAEFLTIADADDLSFGDGSTDGPFSISMWVRGDVLEDAAYINKSDALGTNNEWVLLGGVADAVAFVVIDNSEATCYLGRSLNTTEYLTYVGQWVHIVGVYDGTGSTNQSASIKVYLNGVQRDNADLESNPGNYVAMEPLAADIVIGKSIVAGPAWADGHITKIKIFGSELTPMQVADLFQRERKQINRV